MQTLVDMPRRGVGQGWDFARPAHGCTLKMRGVLPSTAAHAKAYGAALIAQVREAEPAAACMMFWEPAIEGAGSTLVLIVSVSADDLAVFQGGPMHRKAIKRAVRAARRAPAWYEWKRPQTTEG